MGGRLIGYIQHRARAFVIRAIRRLQSVVAYYSISGLEVRSAAREQNTIAVCNNLRLSVMSRLFAIHT